jgi:hypothetical protein
MKVIIAGGRDFEDYNLLFNTCNILFKDQTITEIVSGVAKGADILGEQYANYHNIPIKQFPADWNKHGKTAGFKRNIQMAEYADWVVVFWDGKSKGSKHMIDTARKMNLKLNIIYY